MSPGHTTRVTTTRATMGERRTLIVAIAMAVASAVVLGIVAGAWATMPHAVSVTADGAVVRIHSGSSVADLIRLGHVHAAYGDVLSVGGGVAAKGKGGPPTIVRNGRPTALDQPIYDGDVVMSTRGVDVVERTVVATAEIPPALRYVGKGPIMNVATPGTPGVVRVVRGAISGSVVASEVVSQPRASVVVRRSPRVNDKLVALTFDDGPWPGSTLRILRILQREKVPATFFMVGWTATKYPAIARQVAKAGFLVGSHSFGHKTLVKLPKSQVHREVYVGARRVAEITHTEVRWFRSPYGLTDAGVLREVREAHLRVAGWTVDPGDWRRPGAARIVRRVVGGTRPGSIVLLHDGGGDRAQTIAALPKIIRELRKRGYVFVTLDELASRSQ